MFKSIGAPQQLLPLTLFSETHPAAAVGDILSSLTLCRQHLPQVGTRLRRARSGEATEPYRPAAFLTHPRVGAVAV
jgi:hypothetical protein